MVDAQPYGCFINLFIRFRLKDEPMRRNLYLGEDLILSLHPNVNFEIFDTLHDVIQTRTINCVDKYILIIFLKYVTNLFNLVINIGGSKGGC